MDLRPIPTPATDEERVAVDRIVGLATTHAAGNVPHDNWRAASGLRHLLLPGLHAIQGRFGWVSPGALGYLCTRLRIPPAEAYGVATFYALFSLTERPPAVLHACDDLACHAAGAPALTAELERRLGPAGEARAGGTWLRSPCLGLCEHAPAAMLTVAGPTPRAGAWGPITAESAAAALAARHAPAPSPVRLPQRDRASAAPLRLLARAGVVNPTSLDDYRAHGGYTALRLALDRGPGFVLREIADAGLLGRGGAAFPTGRKWSAVAQATARPKYVVCNADESEPGTFKDRVLMEEDPFALVEALTIAGTTVGAELGFIYLRGEYPLAHARLAHAIATARARGFLGDDVLGKGVRFDLELRSGAGAYICGEETALFASLEGFRGEPRTKPPFPVEAGLFGRPTVVNNVETLVNVPLILTGGAPAYRAHGTAASPGTRLFCVSGRVARPGLYELAHGVTLRALLDDAGAVNVQAVLLGGAAGTFVGPDDLDLPLTFEDTRKAGATLGSGVVLVLDRTVALGPVLERIAGFFRDESCGQCVPCRVGTVRQEELVRRLVRGAPHGSVADERVRLRELGQVMRDASICGLGQTAASAIESAVLRLGALLPPGGVVVIHLPLYPATTAGRPDDGPTRTVELTVDGRKVAVAEGATVLDACRALAIEVPTLCFAVNLVPVNACRICVVELEGARTLIPSCSRKAEAGMVIHTDSERVRTSRKLVLELLGSSVDLSATPGVAGWNARYGADPARFGAPAPAAAAGARDAAHPGHHHPPDDDRAATVAQPAKVDNDLFVRDYGKCILCYKCVEACGDDAQHSFAIAVAGRGFDARISTELDTPLDQSACVFCGNCIGVCPTGALVFSREYQMRQAGTWDESKQAETTTVCPYCGVGCALTLHTQDNRVVKVTSPTDSEVTDGHLCVKGRFGWQYVGDD